MSTLAVLREDHALVLEKLEQLRKDLVSLRNGGAVAGVRSTLTEFSEFLEHALKVHFRQEEEALFPVLGRAIGSGGGPIAVMLAEHIEIRNAHDRLTEEISSENPDPEVIVDAGGTIYDVLVPHIDKEDHILFPMAEAHLGPEDLAEVDRLAAAIG